jgi:26S proteasome regulatory subunit N1
MLVERILESDTKLHKPALEHIKTSIKTSTSSMTAVPKPLKFLRPHYANLEKAYESWPAGEDKVGSVDAASRASFPADARRNPLLICCPSWA